MNRAVALRAFFIFTALTILAAVTGIASHAEIAEVLFLIGGSLSAMMLLFATLVPAPDPAPIRLHIRDRR